MSAKAKNQPKRKRGAARTVEDRIYSRDQGGASRYYVDLRDIDGRRLPLLPESATRATTDYAVALQLAEIVVRDAEEAKRRREAHALESRMMGLDPSATLGAYADYHLGKELTAGNWSASWADDCKRMLRTAVVFFDGHQPRLDAEAWKARRIPNGPRNLQTISTADVAAYLQWLTSQRSTRDGSPLSASARNHHLSALSRLFRRACSEGHCDRNPCQALLDRPKLPPSSTRLYEVREVALILEAARRYDEVNAGAYTHPVLAVLAYAGLRWGEVCNLEVDEVRRGLALGVLDVTTDADRSVKTATSVRRIPLSPELHRILEDYCRRVPRLAGPLFADERADGAIVRMTDRRGSFDSIGRILGMPEKAVRAKRFRVAYATYRSTCDGVSVNDLQHEMGHAGLDLLAKVYARARMTRLRMGEHLDYSASRWLTDADLAQLENIRPRAGRSTDDGREVAEMFLAAIAGLGNKRAAALTSVDINAVRRLRSGKAAPEKLKSKTLAAMRRFLATLEAPAGATRLLAA